MYLDVQQVNQHFGDFHAVKEVSFSVEEGKLVALLGPSGSGKTTVLRMIAGLNPQTSGDIFIDNVPVNTLSPAERGIGLVFQNYALFPYLSVFDNIAYGLRIQKRSKEQIRARVEELLEIVNLKGLEDRLPAQLSGGQRQRVAFARAIAPEPRLILLDEPFSAIDAKVRQEMRSWLRSIITQIGITSIFVTHDQDEAMEVADELIILNEGRLEQKGSPAEIYRHPATPFVAQFIGQSSQVKGWGRLKGFETDQPDTLAVLRPEFVRIEKWGKKNQYCTILEEGEVRDLQFRGDCYSVRVRVSGLDIIGSYSLDEEPLAVGERVQLLISQIFAIEGHSVREVYNRGLHAKVEFYI